jgi:hypothetical protein
MEFTRYSQLDDAWGRVMLGESSSTIAQYGCLLCAVASGMTDVGVKINGLPCDPPHLNRWLCNHKGFTAPSGSSQRNLFVFNSLVPLGVELVDYVDCRKSLAPVKKVVDALEAENHFAVIQVDFKPGGRSTQQHWVRAVHSYDVDFLIMDPWLRSSSENVYLMTSYAIPSWDNPARAIFRIATYRYDPAVTAFTDSLAEKDMIVQDELYAYHP